LHEDNRGHAHRPAEAAAPGKHFDDAAPHRSDLDLLAVLACEPDESLLAGIEATGGAASTLPAMAQSRRKIKPGDSAPTQGTNPSECADV